MKKRGTIAALALLAVLCMLSLSSCGLLRDVIFRGERYSGKYRYQVVGDGEVTIVGYHGWDEDLTIPERIKEMPVTHIAVHAFERCARLRTVTIPDSVTGISSFAFDGCENLEEVTLGRGIQSIDVASFMECPKLRCNEYEGSYYLGTADNPHFVMMAVKKDSEHLSVHPDTVIFADSTLYYADSLKSIAVGEGNARFKAVDNVLFSLDGTQLYKYPCDSEAAAYHIPDGTVTVMPAAFMGAKNLTEVTIPDSVTLIGGSAFRVCEVLERVTLGDGLKTIGNYAFGACTALTEITIPDSVNVLGSGAFGACTALETAVIGKGVTDMGQGVFRGCTALREVVFLSPEGWKGKVYGKLGYHSQDIDTSDPMQNAVNLTGELCELFWYK